VGKELLNACAAPNTFSLLSVRACFHAHHCVERATSCLDRRRTKPSTKQYQNRVIQCDWVSCNDTLASVNSLELS